MNEAAQQREQRDPSAAQRQASTHHQRDEGRPREGREAEEEQGPATITARPARQPMLRVSGVAATPPIAT